MKPAPISILNFIYCGTGTTAITHRLNDGFGRRAGLKLSGVVTLAGWLLLQEDVWFGHAARFATEGKIAARPVIREKRQA